MDRDRRLNRILLEMLAVPVDQRAERLVEACDGDHEMAGELSAILECEDRLGGFLDAPPTLPAASWTSDIEQQPPERIGNYRVVEALGQGGMGTVYLAEQTEPVRRQVALKVISETRVGAAIGHRFQAESQALARMSHPNIAQVYDAGLAADGRAYIAMEYVPGTSITEYCDDRRLGVQERLDLFVEVCDGVRHAHEKGILHRDIKPSNILVTEVHGRATPKIIDFGIAKALDEPLTDTPVRTDAHQVIGTPGFLSPEALLGQELDTRSDVYSLGLVLHRILVGALPETGERGLALERSAPSEIFKGLAELEKAARNCGLSPGALLRCIRGDLDWITLKAIAADRERRYGSAAELAADLQLHRRHRPVQAAPDRFAYRLGKLVRRHRVFAIASGIVALALIVALVSTTLSARRARHEAVRAGREAEAARQVTAFMVDLFENADPTRTRGEKLTVTEVLDRGAERVEHELDGQPLIQATTMRAIGRVYNNLGLFARAEPLLAQALELRQRELGEDHLATATSCEDLAGAYYSLARYTESEQLGRRALRIRESILGPDHADVARSLARLAMALWAQGQTHEAEELLGRAWEIHEHHLAPDHHDRAMVLNNHAIVLEELGRFDEAAGRYREALKLQERTLGENHPWLAVTTSNLAKVLKAQGRFEEAEPLCRRALTIREQVLGPHHPDVAVSLNMLANLHLAREDHEAAEPLLERALSITEQVMGPEHLDVAYSLGGLATVCQARGQHERAFALRERALHLWRQHLGPRHPHVATATLNLGIAAMDLGRVDEAEGHLEQALVLFEQTSGPQHPDTGYVLNSMGALRRSQGRDREAEDYYRRAIAVRESMTAQDPVLREVVAGLAELLREQGREAEAAEIEARLTS